MAFGNEQWLSKPNCAFLVVPSEAVLNQLLVGGNQQIFVLHYDRTDDGPF